MFPQPRYVYFNSPFFLIVVAVVGVTIWQGIREMPSRLAQIAAIGAIALLPILPGLLDGLWIDREWTARYWQNPSFEGRPALTQDEPVITHDWGDAEPFDEWQPDYFSARYERSEYSPRRVDVRHQARRRRAVYVDGELIYENWVPGFTIGLPSSARCPKGGTPWWSTSRIRRPPCCSLGTIRQSSRDGYDSVPHKDVDSSCAARNHHPHHYHERLCWSLGLCTVGARSRRTT
jgi:hypothetical protein